MNTQELSALLTRLLREPHETEWLEFKDSYYEPQILGEYLSALSNAACLAGKPRGYLIFGIHDQTHTIVGTQFDPYVVKAKGNQDLLLWLAAGLQPNVGLEVSLLAHPNGKVVIFEIGPAWDRPVRFYGTAFIRMGTSRTELHKYPEKERAIWSRRTDWSGQVCEGANITDLDTAALLKAREQFCIKHPSQAGEMASWDDATFLNKARFTVHGSITNTALLLLGKPEAATLLSPAVARISWILKDAQNRELDYEHFGPPFLLQVDRVLGRIRNLNIRTMPSGTLFPQEITQYDQWVIREALHNAIAHQDYGLRGRINVVETPSSILITNVGSFLPGDVDKVIMQDAPLEIYRNPFLAEAMVNMNMIDTQGGGIKRMFQKQMQRFLPMPDFNLADRDRVQVLISGNILDEQYSRMLMERSDLMLWQVILIDRVQKRQPITREAHHLLKTAGLVEGRYPNLFIAASVAKITGQKARHVRERGFNKQYYLDMIVRLISELQPIPRAEIDRLLMDKMPDVLDNKQKKAKIHNLMTALASKGKIENRGSRGRPAWHTVDKTGF